MTQSEATAIISNFAIDHDSGILEALEYMQGVYNESGQEEWAEQFTIQERRAYWIVMEGMREMFFGSNR